MRPVDSKFKVTLGYHEKASFDPNYVHRGIDYGCPQGTTVRASKAGQVVHAGTGGMGPAFGIHVVVKSSGTYHIYAHLSSESVFTGQGVTAGQILGKSGATGNVTGAHLHYGEFTSYWYTADRKPQFVPAETSTSGTPPTVAVTAEDVVYVVSAKDALNGREWPVNGPVVKTAEPGAIITSVGHTAKQSDGEVWVKNISGLFWCKKYLTVKTAAPAPTPPAHATVRAATCNLPDAAKLPNTAKRIARGVTLLKAANVGIIGGNEWVGRTSTGAPSSHAKAIFAGLGLANGKLITPTTDWNENYIVLDESKVTLVKQYPDKILPAASGGRHLTPIVVKDVETGKVLVYGQTHLVNGADNGADRTKQAATAMTELTRISKLHDNAPIILGGDMNRSDDLPAMITAGLVNSKKVAKAKTGASYATFTTYANLTPSKNLEHTYDHFYVPKAATVNGWTNVTDSPNGKFTQPRHSDHSIVVTSVTL